MLPIVKQLNLKRIVLASSSPRRKELLQNIVSQSYYVANLINPYIFANRIRFIHFQGLTVESCASTFEEDFDIKDFAGFSEFVEATALQKILEVESRLNGKAKADGKPTVDIVIGADTMVALDGQLYGKPKTPQDALDTLQK